MFEKKQTGANAKETLAALPDIKKEAEEERKRGGRRKFGGKLDGGKSEHRPDRRARGGSVGADMHPETAAGKMSTLDYERGRRGNSDEEGAGRGPDKNAGKA